MKYNIILPHSANQQIPLEKFLAAWIIWVERFHHSTAWQGFHFPFDWRKEHLAILLKGERLSGLDAMVRLLASPSARNTMQISDDFIASNAKWLRKCNDAISSHGNQVAGAVLNSESIDLWNTLPEQERDNFLKETTQLASDVFETVCGIDEVDSEEEDTPDPELCAPDVSMPSLTNGADWVQKFVEMVHDAPFVTHYRGNPVASEIYGWGNRLNAYFWPTPACGLSFTVAALSSHISQLQLLANKVLARAPWTAADQGLAIQAATGVFQWGRVLRAVPKPDQVRAVMEMAIHGSSTLAYPPMNSTWTKLAAFSTEHLANPQVIWDSRVATSVTWRLEQLFLAGGLTKVPYGSPGIAQCLGPMQVGRGGTRPRRLTLNWKNAYGRWPAQFAASEFVRAVRDYLNANSVKYSKSSSQTSWTLREVEQVLFMDGY